MTTKTRKSPFKTYGGVVYSEPNGYMPKSLSYSAIRCYQNCPRDFYFKYVLGIWNNEWRPAFAFGHIMHKMLETHMKFDGDRDFVEAAMISACESEGLKNALIKFEVKKKGTFDMEVIDKEVIAWKKQLWGMYENNAPHLAQWTPIETEKWFDVPLRNPDRPEQVLPVRLKGVIDLVAEGLIVVDHKTGMDFRDDKEYETDMQPYLYAMACKEIYGKYPNQVAFNSLLKRRRDYNTKVSIIDFDLTRLAIVYREVVNVIQLMLLGEWGKGGSGHYYFCDTCRNF